MDQPDRTQTLKRCFGEIYKQGRIIDDYKVKHLHITGVQARYIEIIGNNPGISQDAIARIEGVNKGSIARAIKKLEVEQYITRQRNKADCRAWCLYLTQRGEAVFAEKECRNSEFENVLLKGFTEEEIDTLTLLMDRLTDNLKTLKAERSKQP